MGRNMTDLSTLSPVSAQDYTFGLFCMFPGDGLFSIGMETMLTPCLGKLRIQCILESVLATSI